MKNRKKMIAAVAAVIDYIKTGEEALFLQAAMPEPIAVQPVQVVNMNLWSQSGRHSQMQMRSLLQAKAFHGSNLR